MSKAQDWIEEQQHFIGLFATLSRVLEHFPEAERVDNGDIIDTIVQKMKDCLVAIDGQKPHLALLEIVALTGYTAPRGLQGVMEHIAKSLSDFLSDHQDLQLVSMKIESNGLLFTTTGGRSFVVSLQWAKKLAKEGITDLARYYANTIQRKLDGEEHIFDFILDTGGWNSFTFRAKDAKGKPRKLKVTVVEEV
jgi:hypothetical protein